MFKNKQIIIIGGTGSFGKMFAKTILKKFKVKRLIIFSRDEAKQNDMLNSPDFKQYNEYLRFFIGDVRDRNRLMLALEDVDYVVHAAALKQVTVGEYNPIEVIKTNVLGAQNIIEASIEKRVKRVIALSTDKAAAPVNLYGATKLCSDKLFVSAKNYIGRKNIKFSVVRYGNVMGSRGSVIPFFLKLSKNDYLPITDKRMTRFNITLQHGVDFVINCFGLMKGSEIFIPKTPSYRLIDLANAINKKAKLKYVGIRPGEKIHEEMITKSDALTTVEFEKFFIIFQNQLFYQKNFKQIIKTYKSKFKKICDYGFSYNSDNNYFLTTSEIRKLLKQISI